MKKKPPKKTKKKKHGRFWPPPNGGSIRLTKTKMLKWILLYSSLHTFLVFETATNYMIIVSSDKLMLSLNGTCGH